MGARGYAMSDFSPTLVLQTSIAKSPNDMANVQIKSEKLTPFGGIFPIMEQFDVLLDQTIGSTLGLRYKKSPITNDRTFCTPLGARTLDPLIKSQLLYQLS